MKLKLILIVLFLVFIPASIYLKTAFSEETLTVTTYYPSPYGSYNQLNTNYLQYGLIPSPPAAGSSCDAVEEGKSFYNKNDKNLYICNGSNWVVQGRGVSYTYYCFENNDYYGTPVCPASVTIGSQGPCDSGFKVQKDLGSWGNCIVVLNPLTGLSTPYTGGYLPPGCSCSNGVMNPVGHAYLCSK